MTDVLGGAVIWPQLVTTRAIREKNRRSPQTLGYAALVWRRLNDFMNEKLRCPAPWLLEDGEARLLKRRTEAERYSGAKAMAGLKATRLA